MNVFVYDFETGNNTQHKYDILNVFTMFVSPMSFNESHSN